MALTEQRILPPEYLEALGKTYGEQLTTEVGQPITTTAEQQQPGETAAQWQQRQAAAQQYGITRAGMADLAPKVALQDQYQIDAYEQAVDPTKGLGAFQPYLTAAGTAATGATALTGTGAGDASTAGSIQSYMSPYQTSVIDSTLAEFDRQRQIQENKNAAAALGTFGAFGGGREGVQRAEYQALSDVNRAGLQAGLQQQGFQQAQSARQQDFANQQGIANLQSSLGKGAQDLYRGQIAGLGALGATQQAQTQAGYDAERQAAQMATQERFSRLGTLGSGVTGLMGGAAGQGTQITDAPTTSPLASALGIGATAAGIYGSLYR
jgi:Arc/MetJ-type ribon-helix-helix transcriptional regulator